MRTKMPWEPQAACSLPIVRYVMEPTPAARPVHQQIVKHVLDLIESAGDLLAQALILAQTPWFNAANDALALSDQLVQVLVASDVQLREVTCSFEATASAAGRRCDRGYAF